MTVKHTPGPWVVDQEDHVNNEADDTIALVGRWSSLTPDQEADVNARLIAAAPDLLEACKEMIGTLWFNSPHGADVINADAYKQMVAAIAKAEGRA